MDISFEERQELNRALGDISSPVRRKAVRAIAVNLPELDKRNERRRNCSFRRPCNFPECDHCGGGMPYRANTKNDFIYQQRADPKQSRGKSKNYRSVAGRWLTEPFNGFSRLLYHPFTIDMYIEHRSMDGIETTRRERAKFQSFIKQELPDAIVRLICDISTCAVDHQYRFIPDNSVHPLYRDGNRLSEFGFNFHGHGFIFHPFLTRYQIAKKMRAFYPGEGRICFGNPKPTIETVDGYLSGGDQGWAEYGGLEPTTAKLPYTDPINDSVAAVQHMLLIRNSWPRSSRKITYGDKLQRVSGIQMLMTVPTDPVVTSCAPKIVCEDGFYDGSLDSIPLITSPAPNHIQ